MGQILKDFPHGIFHAPGKYVKCLPRVSNSREVTGVIIHSSVAGEKQWGKSLETHEENRNNTLGEPWDKNFGIFFKREIHGEIKSSNKSWGYPSSNKSWGYHEMMTEIQENMRLHEIIYIYIHTYIYIYMGYIWYKFHGIHHVSLKFPVCQVPVLPDHS